MGTWDGSSCTKEYDTAGRPLKKTYSGATPAVTYEYLHGRLRQVSNSAATVTYDYDELDRVKTRTQRQNNVDYVHTATYRPGSMEKEIYHSGRAVSYSTDAVGRVTAVTGTKTGETDRTYASSVNYAPHGGFAELTTGGQTESWSWNYRLQATGVTRGTLSLGYGYCPSGPVCTTNNGNVMSQTIGHAGATQTYEYDALGRLSSVTEGSTWSRTYGYDRFGNQWVSAWTGIAPDSTTAGGSGNFDIKNRLNILNAHYDEAGNQDVLGGYTRAYDAQGRMISSTINGVTTTLSYDGEGRRVRKQVGGRSVELVYGIGGNLAEEYDTGGASGNGTEFLAVDHLGSTRMVFGAGGAVTQCLDYVPFGEQILQGVGGRTGACWAKADEPRMKFTGKERGDAETGLDYFGARYFSGAQGRFTSADPLNIPNLQRLSPEKFQNVIGDPQNWNAYGYAHNNPLAKLDPDGFLTIVIHGTGANGSPNWSQDSDIVRRVSKTFGEQAVAFYWSGGNNAKARKDGAFALAGLIKGTLKAGEKLNIVAHSHGGNVAFLATHQLASSGIKIDNLVTLGTPIRPDHMPDLRGIGNAVNVFSPADGVQIRGGNMYSVMGNEAGPAGREIEDSDHKVFHNLKVNVAGNWVEAHSNLARDPSVLKQLEPLLKK